jgi:aspartate aminotransferase
MSDSIDKNVNLIKAKILSRVEPPATIAITQLGRDLSAKGHDVVSLSIGEPDFDTPAHVKEATYKKILEGGIGYTPIAGIPELKQAVRDKFARDNGLEYRDNEVMISAGGKQVISNALYATLNDGDEVILPAPYWLAYHQVLSLFGGKPIVVNTSADTGYKVSAQALDASITKNTRWLILNSPGNPTGAVYSKSELQVLAEVLEKHPHVWVLSDDMYEHLIYSEEGFFTVAEVAPQLKNRTLTVNGVSKAYAMTGWRVGYAGGPSELIKAMELVQSQMTVGTSRVSQWAAIAALNGPQDSLEKNLGEYRARRKLLVEGLNDIPGLNCLWPDGAFYAFPLCAAFIGGATNKGTKITSDVDFCMALLREQFVATVHGTAFGLSPHFRVSYAASETQLTEALERIARFCEGIG